MTWGRQSGEGAKKLVFAPGAVNPRAATLGEGVNKAVRREFSASGAKDQLTLQAHWIISKSRAPHNHRSKVKNWVKKNHNTYAALTISK